MRAFRGGTLKKVGHKALNIVVVSEIDKRVEMCIRDRVRAMKIPEALDKLSSMFGKLSKDMAQDTKKLSAMQTELQGAKGHLKNMGLLFMGKAAKEAEHSKSDKGVLSRLSRLFEKTQKGFASLEQKAMDTADKLRVSRVKSSVKENLSRYRAVSYTHLDVYKRQANRSAHLSEKV